MRKNPLQRELALSSDEKIVTETIGRLNGINAPIGTIIGVDRKTLKYLAIGKTYWESAGSDGGTIYRLKRCDIRYATDAEITAMDKHEPNSYVEHRALFRQISAYGLVRQHFGNWKPTGILNFPINRPTPYKRVAVSHKSDCNGTCGQCPGDCGQSICNCTCEFQGR